MVISKAVTEAPTTVSRHSRCVSGRILYIAAKIAVRQASEMTKFNKCSNASVNGMMLFKASPTAAIAAPMTSDTSSRNAESHHEGQAGQAGLDQSHDSGAFG